MQAAKPKVQFLLLAALNEALTSLAAPGATPSSLSDDQRDQVAAWTACTCCCLLACCTVDVDKAGCTATAVA